MAARPPAQAEVRDMLEVSRELVKVFFESNGFLVQEDDYLYVVSRQPGDRPAKPEFVLQSDNVSLIGGAIVSVRAWHSSIFSPSRMSSDSHLFDLLKEENLERAGVFFEGRKFKKVLVLSRLPRDAGLRDKSIGMLRAEGLDHILEFSTVLSYLAREVDPQKHYAHSYILQLVRLLKAYGFLKEPQLELFDGDGAQ